MNAPPDPNDLLIHAGFVRGIARAALRGDDSVDDVVQETWLAALSGGPRSEQSAKSWLARVTRNISFGVLRGNRRRTAREETSARGATVPSTAAIAEKEETRRKLLDALLEVREPSRSALVLRYYEDLPPREVAKRLDVPVETARTRIKRGLSQLRESLDTQHGGDRKTWALALLPLAGEWAKPASTALGVKILAGAAATAAIVTLVVANNPSDDDMAGVDRPNVVQVHDPKDAPTLLGNVTPDEVPAGRTVVFGHVTADSEPLNGRVIFRKDADVLAQQALEDGRFRFERVVPGTLSIELAGEPVIRHATKLQVDGQHERFDIRLPTTRRAIAGRMTYADGRPFRGAVHMTGRARRLTFVTTTDKTGQFRFPRVPTGEIWLYAIVPDTLRATGHFEAGATTFDMVVDAGEVEHHGRVVADGSGAPIEGALVQVYGRAKTRSGPDGRFTIPGKKDAFIGVSHPDYPLGEVRKDEDGTHHLRGGGRIHGTVRDASGKAVGEGVRVHAVTQEENFGRRLECLTDERGRYELVAAPGLILMYAAGDDVASAQIQTWRRGHATQERFALRPGDDVQRDLGVVATGALIGKVRNEDDEPLVGALVAVSMHRDVTTPKGVSVRPRYTATDEQGAFRVVGLVPGVPYHATASRYDHAQVRTRDAFRVAAGGVASVTLYADRSRRATITVLNDATDQPVPGVELKVATRRGYSGVEWSSERATHTDEHGVGRLAGLDTGKLSYRVMADGYVRDANWHPLPEAVGDFEVTVRIAPEMTVTGRVLVPDSVPLANIQVKAMGIDGHVMNGSSIPMGNAKTGVDGMFAFHGMHPGPYRLTARTLHDNALYLGSLVVRESTDDVELRLTDKLPPGAWRVRVFGPDGAPTGVWVARIAKSGRRGYTGYGDTKGGTIVQFSPFHPTTQQVHIFAAPVVRKQTPDGVAGGVLLGPFPIDGRELEVRLPPGRIVSGVARFENGQPLANRRLTVTPILPGPIQSMHYYKQVVQTDSLGRYRLRGLGALTYSVSFQKDAKGWAPDAVQINAEVTQHDIVLPDPPDAIRLAVKDARGDPARGAWVRVYPKGGAPKPLLSAKARGDGVAHLTGLDPGETYALVARQWGKQSASYWNSAWVARDDSIDLVAELPFEGVIKAPDGSILRRARLYRRTPMGTWELLNEHPTTPFRLRLPPGRHFVQAVYRAKPREGQGVWVEAGDTNAVIPFDPGAILRVQLPRTDENISVSVQREGTPSEERLYAHADREGVVEVLGLEADATYVLWASPDRIYGAKDTGRCIFRTGLKPDGVLRELDWARSTSISGTVRVPKGTQVREAKVHVDVAGMRDWALVKSDGTFRAQGVPPGDWRLVATLKMPDGRELRAEAGTNGSGPVELVLK